MRKFLFVTMLVGLLTQTGSAQLQRTQAVDPEPTPSNAPYTTRGYSLGRGGMARRDPRAMQDLINGWKVSKDAVERDKIEQVLRDALKSEFTARLADHEKEIKDLEAKVRELRNRLNLRREKQDEIVDHRLQQILREAQGLGWGSEARGGGYGGGYGWAGMEGEYGGGYGGYSTGTDYPTSTTYGPRTAPSALEPVPGEETSTSTDIAPAERDPEPSPGRN